MKSKTVNPRDFHKTLRNGLENILIIDLTAAVNIYARLQFLDGFLRAPILNIDGLMEEALQLPKTRQLVQVNSTTTKEPEKVLSILHAYHIFN